MAASRDLGEFIRELRNNARISLRQLAKQAGVSNPYLSQIERGLRKPSAEVLQQIANALKVSTPVMYLRAGLLAEKDGQGVIAAIMADPDLTDRHKKTLIEIYEAFRRETTRANGAAGKSAESTGDGSASRDADPVASAAATQGDSATPEKTATEDSAVPRASADRATRTAGTTKARRSVRRTANQEKARDDDNS